MANLALLRSDCWCFSVCSAEEAATFLNAIPAWIDSSESVWLRYLEAVYGEAPPLPFHLADVNFFYHSGRPRGGGRPRREMWPMRPCVMRRRTDPASGRPLDGMRWVNSTTAHAQCPANVCSSWRASAQHRTRLLSLTSALSWAEKVPLWVPLDPASLGPGVATVSCFRRSS